MNITISLCLIVKNEENVLARCLSCVKDIVDEIIVLDTGSSDNTKNIATQNGAKVYDFVWCDNFAAARNKAFSYATSDYILWLDADDIITTENIIKLKQLKQNLNKNIDAVSMVYGLVYDKYGNTSISLKRNRLVKANKNFKWIGHIHEYLEVFGNIMQSDIEISHKKMDFTHSDRNLKIFESMKKMV